MTGKKTVSIHLVAQCGAALAAALGLGTLLQHTPVARLPAGVELEVHARGLEHARGMALAEDGTLLVGSTRAGLAYEISPERPDLPPLVALVATEFREAIPAVEPLQLAWSEPDATTSRETPRPLDALAERWTREGSPWGRNVDMVLSPDGTTLFVTHRRTGVVYRLRGPEPRVLRSS